MIDEATYGTYTVLIYGIIYICGLEKKHFCPRDRSSFANTVENLSYPYFYTLAKQVA